jgi:hypothetical protein
VKSLFTSKIFLAQVVTLVAMVATMAGYHPAWATEANQAELVSMIDLVATTAFRMFGVNGPVSLTAPISTPAPQDLLPGSQAVEVKADPNAPVAIQQLAPGVHTVTVLPPPPPPPAVPPSLTVVSSGAAAFVPAAPIPAPLFPPSA